MGTRMPETAIAAIAGAARGGGGGGGGAGEDRAAAVENEVATGHGGSDSAEVRPAGHDSYGGDDLEDEIDALEGGPLACFLEAREELGDFSALRLCQGARNTGPVACYLAAEDLLMSEQHRVLLCQCARSPRPVACYETADWETTLSPQQIFDLCAPTYIYGLNSACVPACRAPYY